MVAHATPPVTPPLPARRAVPPAVAHYRGRKAALSRSRAADDPELIEVSQKLAGEVISEHVKRVVDKAPPLNDEQIRSICALLRTGKFTPTKVETEEKILDEIDNAQGAA